MYPSTARWTRAAQEIWTMSASLRDCAWGGSSSAEGCSYEWVSGWGPAGPVSGWGKTLTQRLTGCATLSTSLKPWPCSSMAYSRRPARTLRTSTIQAPSETGNLASLEVRPLAIAQGVAGVGRPRVELELVAPFASALTTWNRFSACVSPPKSWHLRNM